MTFHKTYYVTQGDETDSGQKELSAFIQDVMDATIEESADGRYFIRGEIPLRGEIPPLPPSSGGEDGVQRPKSSRGLRGERPLSARGDAPPLPPSSGGVQRPSSSRGVRGEFPPSIPPSIT